MVPSQTFIISGATNDPDVARRTTTDLRFKRTFDEVTGMYHFSPKWYFHTGHSPPTVTARMFMGSVRGNKFAGLIRFIMAPNHVEHVLHATPPEKRGTWDNIRWVNIVLARLMRTTLVQIEGDYDIPEVAPTFEEFLCDVAKDRLEPGTGGLPPTIRCPLSTAHNAYLENHGILPT